MISSEEILLDEADRIGFPIMVKAAAGGGGSAACLSGRGLRTSGANQRAERIAKGPANSASRLSARYGRAHARDRRAVGARSPPEPGARAPESGAVARSDRTSADRPSRRSTVDSAGSAC